MQKGHHAARRPLAGATQEAELGQLAAGQAAPPGGMFAASGREMLVAPGARTTAAHQKAQGRMMTEPMVDPKDAPCTHPAGETLGAFLRRARASAEPAGGPQVTLERQPGEDAAHGHPSQLSARVVCEDVGGGH